ncbi:OmpW family outer membrane protein [Thioalkalivibrio sp. XN8]|uniref:OmpW/AlkL family protein n=1 Tax=Thioalkalivibrio sp. XN8 TaxID=2712863 RepID=UPI0013EA75D4|nr:OmpW family outer membrane protein [Thioalkalivibrio sp. XN8]NGP54235.1 OmpW family protein [Thioalkalivibrio sp. XN8]
MRTLAPALALTAALGLVAPASAHEAGDWLVRFGASAVDPKSDNGSLDLTALGDGPRQIQVDDKTGVTFNFTYMYTKNIGVEVLAALPFEHDIFVETLGLVGSVKHLPPTISLQYHFMPDSVFQPYAGIGVNYTRFFSESEKGVLVDPLGVTLDIDSSSFGLAAQLGFDYMVTDQWFLNFDVRYIDIDTTATITEVPAITGDVNIDPVVYGIHLGYRF